PWPGSRGRLYAIADLHLSYPANREALEKLRHYPGDGLIICGDVGETTEHLEFAFRIAKERFAVVWWCPGNHELYTSALDREHGSKGEKKYFECVHVARGHGVLTPEDSFVVWDGEGGPCVIAPIFTLYDYSFRPDHVSLEGAVKWAKEEGIEATDEHLLYHEPYSSRQEWCGELVEKFQRKLEEAQAAHPGMPMVIANHWPLREDLIYLRMIPRFSIWCGTKKTEDWHKMFGAKVVVSGHLHIRRTDWKDSTRFEECSLGYPRQWKECMDKGMDVNEFLREILPGPSQPKSGNAPTLWRR
ncbi:metallophosphoesteras-like protein, partial [Rhizodiscina lignyota]